MVAIAFYSITGQTERFIKKTQLSAHQIDDANPQTAKKIAATLKVPILYLLEFSGTNQDVKNVRKIVHDLSAGESTKQVQKPKELRGNISFLSDFRD